MIVPIFAFVAEFFKKRNRFLQIEIFQQKSLIFGAGEGNRTLIFSLEGCNSTIELHPRNSRYLYTKENIMSTKFFFQLSSPLVSGRPET
jgi:hypothetical protein